MEFEGKRIKAAAAQAGTSLTELADRIGLSRSTLYAYVSGAIQPSEERMREIAALTNCPLEFFLFRPRSAGAGMEGTLPLAESLLSGANPTAAAEFLEGNVDSIPEDRRGDLLLRLANSLALEGSYQEAIDWGLRARSLFEAKKDTPSVGRCHQTLGFCYTNVGPLKRAHICFLDAESRLAPTSKWKARVALAVVAERRGEFESALQIVQEVQAGPIDPAAQLYSLGVKGNILANLGQWDKVLEIENEALSLAEELGARDQIGERLIALALASIYTRQPDTDCRVAQATGFFQSQVDAARKTLFRVTQSLAHLQKGDVDRATCYAEEALEAAIKGHYRRAELAAYLRLAEIALREKQTQTAISYSLKAAAYAESYEYATERDYAESLAAYLLASGKDGGTAARHVSTLDSRGSWEQTSPTREIVSAARALVAGETVTAAALVEQLHSKGIAFVPGFEA